MRQSDILVIGGGIAGLFFALKTAHLHPSKKITVLTKTNESESNTRYAQGGVAAVWDMDKDSFAKHIADTHDAGDGLCNPKIVEIVVEEGPDRVRELIEWGTRFDFDGPEYDLAMEGGHSEHRILHYKDLTGWEIQRALLAQAEKTPNLELLEYFFAIDLITQHHLGHWVTRATEDLACYGCYAINSKSGHVETFVSKVTVLATGGVGQVYRSTTNPSIATGDGIAMVYRAKGRVENMEFVQFHPTSLYDPTNSTSSAFLVSEAVRGFGGILKNKDGEEFMHKYDERLSLAPRDIVARAIDNEMKLRGDDYMCLDCKHLDMEKFREHFPTIYDKCISLGIDPAQQMIPVVPACHYMCGGIRVDEWGQSSLANLYACGECTCTGLHGANRLASNSLLEAMVFADRIFHHISPKLDHLTFQQGIPAWSADGTSNPRELVLITQSLKELKEIMSSYVGIVRTDTRLARALNRLELLYKETEELYQTTVLSPQLCELRNLITIAYLISRSASLRKESRGLHYNTDYPERKPFIVNSVL